MEEILSNITFILNLAKEEYETGSKESVVEGLEKVRSFMKIAAWVKTGKNSDIIIDKIIDDFVRDNNII